MVPGTRGLAASPGVRYMLKWEGIRPLLDGPVRILHSQSGEPCARSLRLRSAGAICFSGCARDHRHCSRGAAHHKELWPSRDFRVGRRWVDKHFIARENEFVDEPRDLESADPAVADWYYVRIESGSRSPVVKGGSSRLGRSMPRVGSTGGRGPGRARDGCRCSERDSHKGSTRAGAPMATRRTLRGLARLKP